MRHKSESGSTSHGSVSLTGRKGAIRPGAGRCRRPWHNKGCQKERQLSRGGRCARWLVRKGRGGGGQNETDVYCMVGLQGTFLHSAGAAPHCKFTFQ